MTRYNIHVMPEGATAGDAAAELSDEDMSKILLALDTRRILVQGMATNDLDILRLADEYESIALRLRRLTRPSSYKLSGAVKGKS